MCGIAGIVGLDPQWVAEEHTVRSMCRTLVHRGPDDEGVRVSGPAGLGMRRLSIIDLAGGHQPLSNEDQSIWVVLNGEIYNFPALRARLEKSGHRFQTNSDTEVIVHLYEEEGIRCVDKLRGMFAFALYDEKQRRLLLARDRLGKKPLYYAIHQQRLIFGSEIKALLAAAPELAEVSRESLLHYFSYGYVPDPLTAFGPIRKLSPGHTLELADGRVQVREYWDLPRYGVHEPSSEEEALEDLEERLEEAVRIRLISDVPLGALLSGGVDSSTVVALMRRASAGPVKTFSIAFRSAELNEAQHARTVAQAFGTEHHEMVVEADIWETLDTLTHSLEEPLADSTLVPQFHLSRMARQHVTVALAGDGGDELFAGYDRYRNHLQGGWADRVPAWMGKLHRGLLDPVLPEGMIGKRRLFNLSLPPGERFVDSVSFFPVATRGRSLFTAGFLSEAAKLGSPAELFQRYYERAPANDGLSRLLYLDSKTNLPGDILTKVDRMSMAASLEVRAPLLDHALAEWAASLTPHWKLRNGEGKYLLRKLARRLGVPSSVLDRPKRGFTLPLAEWMRQDLKNELPRLLLEPRTLQRGYWNRQAVERLLTEHFRGRRDHCGAIWLLMVFELWHRNFLEQPNRHAQAAAVLRVASRGPERAEESSLAISSPAPSEGAP